MKDLLFLMISSDVSQGGYDQEKDVAMKFMRGTAEITDLELVALFLCLLEIKASSHWQAHKSCTRMASAFARRVY